MFRILFGDTLAALTGFELGRMTGPFRLWLVVRLKSLIR